MMNHLSTTPSPYVSLDACSRVQGAQQVATIEVAHSAAAAAAASNAAAKVGDVLLLLQLHMPPFLLQLVVMLLVF